MADTEASCKLFNISAAKNDRQRGTELVQAVLCAVSQQSLTNEVPGVYTTDDVALCDEEGYFTVVGRADDVLNVAGHRIGTADVEGALVSHPGVAEAAVIGRPDEIANHAERPRAPRARRYCRPCGDRLSGQAAEDTQRQDYAALAEGARSSGRAWGISRRSRNSPRDGNWPPSDGLLTPKARCVYNSGRRLGYLHANTKPGEHHV